MCTDCEENNEIKDGLCVCMSGFKENSENICSPCHISCDSCQDFTGNSNDCLSCIPDSGRVYDEISNTCNCLAELQEIGQATCCKKSCQECDTTDKCTKCDESVNRIFDSSKE